jgi:hypothetical protein
MRMRIEERERSLFPISICRRTQWGRFRGGDARVNDQHISSLIDDATITNSTKCNPYTRYDFL